MNRTRHRRDGLTIGVAVVTTLALTGGIAYATIPGTGNVFSACMLKGAGTIRLIDKSLPTSNLMSRCTDKEIEVSWNQAGQPGPPGPQGAKGDEGVPGKDGTNGVNGVNGAKGDKGDKGDPCLSSDPACVGAKGDQGDKGDPCLPSDPACIGPAGPSGPVGGYELVARDEGLNLLGEDEANNIACPQGKHPLGGGGRVFGPQVVVGSFPIKTSAVSGWTVITSPRTSGAATLRLYVICGEVEP